MFKVFRSTVMYIAIVCVVLFLGTYTNALAQPGATTASVNGVIVDEQEAVIPGAKIVIKEIATNTILETLSEESGNFLFPSLKPGFYEIKVEADGFNPLLTRIEIELGTVNKVTLPLKVGGTQGEVIEVTADTNVGGNKTESSTNIDNGRIANLPINRRNFLDFSLTTPRATDDRAAAATGFTSSSGLSFNGQTSRFNNITIDGLDNNNLLAGAVRTTFSQEAVQEYQVVSDTYSAEFGRSLAGVVNIVTKGGANETHGNLFIINRNDKIAARNTFAPFDPPFSQYQFGATLSGALKKDKAFYFVSFERLTVKQNNFVTISDTLVQSGRRLGFTVNNGPIPFSLTSTSLLGRVDTQISPNDRLFIRYNFGGRYDGNFEPFGGTLGEAVASRERVNDNSIAFNNTYINPGFNLVNETRLLFNRRRFKSLPSEEKPMVMFIDVNDAATFGRSTTGQIDYREKSFNIVNNTTLTRGSHLIKFGVDYDYHSLPTQATFFPFGLSLFLPIDFPTLAGNPGLPFFTALAAFDPSVRTPAQIGFLNILTAIAPTMFPGFPSNQNLATKSLPTVFLQGFGDSRETYKTSAFSTFVLDEIQIKPNLSIKLGLRYDITRVKFTPDNNGNISPRISISYRPLEKLNIRAGYGIFFGSARVGYVFPTQPIQSGKFKTQLLPFPFSVIPFNLPGNRFPIVTEAGQLPPGLNFNPALTFDFSIDPNLKASYTQQATLGLEYALSNNSQIGITYNYTRGNKVFLEYLSNPIIRPIPNNPTLSFLTGRVDTTRGQVTTFASIGDSYYHGVSFLFNQRIKNKLTLLAHYTLSKAIDNAVDFRTDLADGFTDSFNFRGERGLSVQDVRHRFIISSVYSFNDLKNVILKDFQLSSIVTLESGHPYNLRSGVDLNSNGDVPPFDRPLFGGSQVGRNVGVLPGFARVDLRVTRFIPINDQFRLEFFAESFNLFNRVNIKSINRFFSPDQMGNFNLPATTGQNGRFIAPKERFTEAFAPRQFQLGFRVTF